MFKEESGVLMLFGADWDAVVTGEPHDDGGYDVIRIVLHGFYDRGVLIRFSVPAIVDLGSVSNSELQNVAEWFDEIEPNDDFDIDGKRWVP